MADQNDSRPQAPLQGEVIERDYSDNNNPPVPVLDSGMIGGLTRAEIDVQIATAHQFPRVVSRVKRQIETLATLDTETAEACFFRLKRGKEKDPDSGKWVDKYIEGPSIRFAEIVLASYGNARVASRRTDITETDIEATGIFHDLETNVAWAKSVRKGIMTSPKEGRKPERYSGDMINTASNGAASVALRNAILAGVPRGYWKAGLNKAMEAARGTAETLGVRRANMVRLFAEQGVSQAQVFELLGVRGLDDVTLDIMFDGVGTLNALRDGDVSLEELLREARGGAEAPKLDAAFGKAKPDPKTATQAKPEGEGKAAAAAPAAASGKDTKESATPASSDSAAEKSGQTDSSEGRGARQEGADVIIEGPAPAGVRYFLSDQLEPYPDGRRQVFKDGEKDSLAKPSRDLPIYEAHPVNKVVDFPGDRQRADTGAAARAEPAQQRHAQEQNASEPAPPDVAYDVAVFNSYASAVAGARTLASIDVLVDELRAEPSYPAAPADVVQKALLMAFARAQTLNDGLFADDKARAETTPWFYRLWLLTAAPHEVKSTFRVLMRSKAYMALTQAEQDTILDETDAAAGA